MQPRNDHMEITVAETVGVEERGKFYEQTGALSDMMPNPVFMLLSMVAMGANVADMDGALDKTLTAQRKPLRGSSVRPH